jgi:hypothetical protein
MEPAIYVSCREHDRSWRCSVRVGNDPGATTHDVTVAAEDLVRLAPTGTPVEALVTASFVYLLDREPRESILPRFDLRVISRYFPEYETEIRQFITG